MKRRRAYCHLEHHIERASLPEGGEQGVVAGCGGVGQPRLGFEAWLEQGHSIVATDLRLPPLFDLPRAHLDEIVTTLGERHLRLLALTTFALAAFALAAFALAVLPTRWRQPSRAHTDAVPPRHLVAGLQQPREDDGGVFY